MEIAHLFTTYLWISIICFGLTVCFVLQKRNNIQDKSTFEEKYEELFKYALSNKNMEDISWEEFNKHATLITISMNLEDASRKEKKAFHKVFKKYKSMIEQAKEKKDWRTDYHIAKFNLKKIEALWKGTKEEMKELQKFKKVYEKISNNLK